MAATRYFIFCNLYHLHTFKMAANMLKTDYYDFNVLHACTVTLGTDT